MEDDVVIYILYFFYLAATGHIRGDGLNLLSNTLTKMSSTSYIQYSAQATSLCKNRMSPAWWTRGYKA